jgi:hypothetical protein
MSDQIPPENDVSREFAALGENLKKVLQAAWESDERRKLQQELEKGASALGASLTDFAQSESGQKIKADLDELREKAQFDKVETNVRDGVLTALRQLNAALEKAAQPKKPEDPQGE